jgi:hypothetical protein
LHLVPAGIKAGQGRRQLGTMILRDEKTRGVFSMATQASLL